MKAQAKNLGQDHESLARVTHASSEDPDERAHLFNIGYLKQ